MKQYFLLNLIAALLISTLTISCSSSGKNQLNEKCFEKVKAFERLNKNDKAVKAARRCNSYTYNQSLIYLLESDRGYYLNDKELAKLQAMNLRSSLSKKLQFQFEDRERIAERLNQNKKKHKEYVKSDKYKELKHKQDQMTKQHRDNYLNIQQPSASKSSGSTNSSGYTQQTTDRYNSAVKSAADKEKLRVKSMENRRK